MQFRVEVKLLISDDRPPVILNSPSFVIPQHLDPEETINAVVAGLVEGLHDMTAEWRKL